MTPIKPGTAKRLGLKPPGPRGFLTITGPHTAEELERIKARFREAMLTGRGGFIAEPPRVDPTVWPEPTMIERESRPTRRRWWRR